jgi:ABC-type multidrug transport system fused ATPase/permease subunit
MKGAFCSMDDLRDLSLQTLRAQISFVLQEPLLFSATVAENIRYGRLDATDDDVIASAKAANAHDFIMRLPQKYDTQLGERGAKMSAGERQRVCIARAFLTNAPILILDEPTSSIDLRTEAIILEALDRLMIGRTSLLIAHRLSTIQNCDEILVLDRGRLVQHGVHDELILRTACRNHEIQHRQSIQFQAFSNPS